MKIILDSNILCQDFHLRSPGFKLLFDGLLSIPAKLYVPQVAIDEVANRFREELQDTLSQANRLQSAMSRLLPEQPPAILPAIDVTQRSADYKSQLVQTIRAIGGEILPYPDITHQEVVERDLMRKKPFKRDGSGYRDLLIWESVKRLVFLGSDTIISITNNTKDFGEGPSVAPELTEELYFPHRLKLFRTLKDFNDSAVLPKLKMLDELRHEIESQTPAEFNAGKWITSRLIDLLRDYEIGSVVLGFPEGVGGFWPRSITELSHVTVNDARQMESGDSFLQLEIKARIDVSIRIDWEDYINHEEVREFLGDNEERFGSVSTDTEDNFVLRVDVILENQTSKVISEDITFIGGPCGTIDLST
jgi:hypothetical protein